MYFPGLLASQGVDSVEVRRKPRVAIISTGNELVRSGNNQLSSGQVGLGPGKYQNEEDCFICKIVQHPKSIRFGVDEPSSFR